MMHTWRLSMEVGDLVRVETKHYGSKLGMVIGSYYEIHDGLEWIVKPLDQSRNMICSPCDLEVISESR